MPSAWITHVKKYAAENNVSYKEALSKASASYKKGSGICESDCFGKAAKEARQAAARENEEAVAATIAALEAIVERERGERERGERYATTEIAKAAYDASRPPHPREVREAIEAIEAGREEREARYAKTPIAIALKAAALRPTPRRTQMGRRNTIKKTYKNKIKISKRTKIKN